MPTKTIQELEQLLARNELDKVIQLLRKDQGGLSDTAQQEFILISSRLEQVRQQEFKGIISKEDATLEMNKIRNALLQFIQKNGQSPEEKTQAAARKRLKWIIPLVIYLVFATALIYWLFLPQLNFRIQANLLVERCSFQYLEGPTNFAQGKVASCYWQNYQSAQLEAESIWVDEDGDQIWETQTIVTDLINIQADENIPGISLRFGPVKLERFFLEPQALLTLSQDENNPTLIQLSIQQNTALKSDWTFQDSLNLEVEMVTLEGIPEITELYMPTKLKAIPPEGKARELQVQSFTGTSNLDLEFASDFEFEGTNLMINNISFYQPLESVAVPTLLGGSVQIGVLDKEPLKTIDIEEGEALDLYSQAPLALESMTFGQNGIQLKLNGKVTGLETGRNHESRTPKRIEWLWHTQKLLVIVLGFAFLVMASFLPPKIRERIFEILKIAKGF